MIRTFQLFVLHDDLHTHSVDVLHSLVLNIKKLNGSGFRFEIIPIDREALHEWKERLDELSINSLPALTCNIPEVLKSMKLPIIGTKEISNFFNHLVRKPPPEETVDYHEWIHARIGDAGNVQKTRGNYKNEEEGIGERQNNQDLNAKMLEFSAARSKFARPSPSSKNMYNDEPKKNETRSNILPSSRPPRATSVSNEDDDVTQAIANTPMDKNERMMLSTLYGNLSLT